MASTQSSIASLQRQVALAENSLSLLLGSNPHAIPRGQSLAEQWRPDDLPAGLPSDLLLRRPDLRAALTDPSRYDFRGSLSSSQRGTIEAFLNDGAPRRPPDHR